MPAASDCTNAMQLTVTLCLLRSYYNTNVNRSQASLANKGKGFHK